MSAHDCLFYFFLRSEIIYPLFFGETHLVLKWISATVNPNISAPAHLAHDSTEWLHSCFPVNALAQFDLSVPSLDFF